jgi:hypothetical protein
VVWELTGGGGERRRGCRAAAVALLGHLDQAVGRGSAWFAGNGRRPGRAACSGELDGVIESREEVVWEVEGGEVHLSCQQWRPFIGGRSEGGRRLWGLAGMRGCPLWCCHERAGVLDREEERQRDGGSGLVSLPFFQVSRPGSGQGRRGVNSGVRGGVVRYG